VLIINGIPLAAIQRGTTMKISPQITQINTDYIKNKKISVISVICGFIFFLNIALGLSSPVYSNSSEKELKGKSNSNSSGASIQSKPQNRPGLAQPGKPSQSSSTPGVENKNNSRGWGNTNPNRDVTGKLKVRTGKVVIHPPTPPPKPPEPIPAPPPDKHPKPRPPRHPRPPCPRHPGYIIPIPGDENEEHMELPDSGNTITPGKSNRLPGKEYQVNESYSLDPLLARKIDEYNAKHLNRDSLEYPRSHWSASLTYQLLESLELIEHMENKIRYYQQQLEAVRNSNLSPAERSAKELFWLERIDRLQASRQKEEERVFELRSQIEEERRKLE
jgi:hypothetical protein